MVEIGVKSMVEEQNHSGRPSIMGSEAMLWHACCISTLLSFMSVKFVIRMLAQGVVMMVAEICQRTASKALAGTQELCSSWWGGGGQDPSGGFGSSLGEGHIPAEHPNAQLVLSSMR